MKFLDDHGEKILYITWGILFIICIIACFDVRVYAEEAPTIESVLPYVPNADDYALTENELQVIQDYLVENNDTHNVFTDKCIIFKYSEGYWWTYSDFVETECYSVLFPQSTSCTSTWSGLTDAENFMFYNSNNYINITFPDVTYGVQIAKRDSSFGWVYSPFSTTGYSRQFYGAHNVITVSNSFTEFSYYEYYPVYTNDIFFTTDPNRYVIPFLSYPEEVPTAPAGSAQAPDTSGDNIGNDKPDIDDYIPTPTNPPAINNNSLENLVESLFNLVLWHAGQIAGLVKGIGEFLADTITYSIQKVIDNIKNAINNIYQNFKNLFEPLLNGISQLLFNIQSKFDYLTAPIDPSVISTGIESTDLVTDVTGYKTALTSFVGSFNNVSEPSTYKIPIHFENISMFSDVGIQYIDLGWLNSVKTLLRGFVACLVTYGVIISIFDSVPNYINGGGGEDD